MDPKQILIKYWGYASFRPMQEDIIRSVLDGRDTLALLPTGGGKSICFQVPVMSMDGLCIVVTPLIALMKDQVENLKKRNISAIALHSGLRFREIDNALDNAVNGYYKFLYVSPERLKTDMFRERVQKMNVCLLAIDEAHCISQWGYDFRPPYLEIAAVRKYFPEVPVLALTATATTDVVDDIMKHLEFRKVNCFKKSFVRDNLSYLVLKEEDKLGRLLRILERVPGTGIVYVRNRKRTQEYAEMLRAKGIKATYYHAGLPPDERNNRQDQWKRGSVRVMVATNAFGMGIDKSNVRFVVHLDIPDTLEAYFQEAGRGGRDEKKAYATILYDKADILEQQRNFEMAWPPLQEIKKVYGALGNFFGLAVGSGKDEIYPFDIVNFSNKYGFMVSGIYHTLSILEKEGYIVMSDAARSTSKIMITMAKTELYRFQVQNKNYDGFIKTLLRSYSGLFSTYTPIREASIAQTIGRSPDVVVKALEYLDSIDVISYEKKHDIPTLSFVNGRIHEQNLYFSHESYKERKKEAAKRLEAVVSYVESTTKCRSQMLVSYFGEDKAKRCGVCDICIERNKLDLSEHEFNTVSEKIKPLLRERSMSIEELDNLLEGINRPRLLKVIEWLIDHNKLIIDKERKLHWK